MQTPEEPDLELKEDAWIEDVYEATGANDYKKAYKKIASLPEVDNLESFAILEDSILAKDPSGRLMIVPSSKDPMYKVTKKESLILGMKPCGTILVISVVRTERPPSFGEEESTIYLEHTLQPYEFKNHVGSFDFHFISPLNTNCILLTGHNRETGANAVFALDKYLISKSQYELHQNLEVQHAPLLNVLPLIKDGDGFFKTATGYLLTLSIEGVVTILKVKDLFGNMRREELSIRLKAVHYCPPDSGEVLGVKPSIKGESLIFFGKTWFTNVGIKALIKEKKLTKASSKYEPSALFGY